MSKLQRYSSYKESDVKWIGEIPEHWQVKKLKFVLKINNGQDYKNVISDEGYPVIGSGGQFAFANQYLYDGEVLLLGRKGTVDKPLYFKGKFWTVDTMFYGIPKQNCNTKFLYYSSLSIPFQFYSTSTALPSMTQFDLNNHKISFPPLPEQTKIAQFLDEKTAQIDQAISQKEKMIELLKERRQIVINDAVTKGINTNIPMKESGVEWIGEIPEHWEISRVKNIFKLIIEPAPNNNDEELLSIYTDIGVRPRKDLKEKGNKASTTDGYWRVNKGDFIVNKLLAWMGAVGLSEYEGVTSPAYDILRAKVPIEGKFYHKLFRLKIFSQEMKKHSRGIMDMRLRLYFDKFGDILIPYPSYDEQLQIVAYIEEHTSKIDATIELQQNYIAKLKEYKATLIDSVVTGKVRVV